MSVPYVWWVTQPHYPLADTTAAIPDTVTLGRLQQATVADTEADTKDIADTVADTIAGDDTVADTIYMYMYMYVAETEDDTIYMGGISQDVKRLKMWDF